MRIVRAVSMLIFLYTTPLIESQAIENSTLSTLRAQNPGIIMLSAVTLAVGVATIVRLGADHLRCRGTNKIALKNGTLASSDRIKEVWQSLQEIDNGEMHNDFFWLWRTCLECKKINDARCAIKTLDHEKLYLRKPSDTFIAKLDSKKITCNGVINEETQNIVISSRTGTGDGYGGRNHPAKRWYEYIPGYSLLPWYLKG